MKHALSFSPRGIAIWNDKLYLLVLKSPKIHVFNVEPFAHQRTITVNGMKIPNYIVADTNALYVSERICPVHVRKYEDNKIHRIQLPEESVSNSWTVDGIDTDIEKVSIAKNGNVIVACWDPPKIFEYTPFGNLVREIAVDRLGARKIGLHHAIQLNGNKFIVCQAATTRDRVCMIDNTGRVIKSYEGNIGEGIGQLNSPNDLAIDRNGFIFVADYDNDRIVQLNSSLEYTGEIRRVQRPHRIHLDEEHGRLYVINNNSLTVFEA